MNDEGRDAARRPREPGAAPRATRGGRAAARGAGPRVEQQPAFVVHAVPWRETSLIVDALTRDHGRVSLVARGAKRPTSQFRGLLGAFNSLSISWSGRGEVKSLVRVDWLGGLAPVRGDGLLVAFYLNELIVRLLARGDPHPALFGAYVQALRSLAAGGPGRDGALRSFELDLLHEIGYGIVLDRTPDGEAVDPAARYRVDPTAGPLRVQGDAGGEAVRGASLTAIEKRRFDDPIVAEDARRLMRQLIGYHLGGRPLNTRRILLDLRQL
ncbi:MAG TPA: DNA repair protein RecO [Burkholderiaceae bacterium]|nr:DNA repair protein RecO [Burkholderiaceae bacterium]